MISQVHYSMCKKYTDLLIMNYQVIFKDTKEKITFKHNFVEKGAHYFEGKEKDR